MKAILIDDVKSARKALYHDLIDYCENIEVTGEADSVKSAISLIKVKQPDLIFLDIELGDGTGFDVIEGLGDITLPHIIFTTAFNQYAIKAFKYGAIDYLLKPIDDEELQIAVKKAHNNTYKTSKEGLNLAKSTINDSKRQVDKVIIHSHEELAIVEIQDIVSCEASSNYTIFHLANKKQIVSSETLKHYDQLFEDHGFFRTHHSHLVNLAYIKSFVKIDGGYLVLKNGTQLPVSTRKKEVLNTILKNRFLN